MKKISFFSFLFWALSACVSTPNDNLDRGALLQDKPEQSAIAALEFLVGDWAGPGVSYRDDGSEVSYRDTEYVRFDLDNKLLLINARGERSDGTTSYSLHTVIYYNLEKERYIYTPYSGAREPRSFECTLNDTPQLVCYIADNTYRLTFQRLPDGKWNEFGERLIDGAWQKNFETILSAAGS